MIAALVPVIIAIVGLVLYAFATNAKASEVGRIMFLCGMLVTTYLVAGRTVHLP